jgi:hypothetical protein
LRNAQRGHRMMNACCSDRAHDCYVLQAVAQMAWCHVLTLQHLLMPHCPTAAVPRELSPSGRHRGQPRVLHHTSSMLSKSSATGDLMCLIREGISLRPRSHPWLGGRSSQVQKPTNARHLLAQWTPGTSELGPWPARPFRPSRKPCDVHSRIHQKT